MSLSTELDLQQKDYLCGPFHAARILRDHGVDADQDLVALRAGSTLGPDGEVPPGARSWQDYRYQLARVEPARAGTSARALAAAIEELSRQQLVCVPLSGRWSALAVEGLFEFDARLIANLRTGLLWGSRPSAEALLAALDGATATEPPGPDWDVGHFVELVQLLRGRHGALVLVRDSYPSLGWAGHHLQPPAALAAALMRGDGREGGVLAVTAPGDGPAVRELAAELSLDTRLWKN